MKKIQVPSRGSVFTSFVMITCLILAGCSKEDDPGSTDPKIPVSPDQSVLDALEPYDPVYKLNVNGRVAMLRLEGRRFPASVVDEVSKLTELTELSLYAARVTDDSLVKLQTLKNLRNLGLGATFITKDGLIHLQALSSLQNIWLSRPVVETTECETLKEAIPGLNVHPQ